MRRDFLLNYQQTVLGPLWILFQPILTLVTFVLVFDKLVGIPTGTIPPVLFYLAGIVLWNFFNDSFLGTSFTFRENAQIFSKVYFPRLVVPLSVMSTHFFRFLMQLVLLLIVLLWYWVVEGVPVSVNAWLLFFPLSVLLIGCIGLSLGLIFSVLTAKYRDLVNLVHLGVRLMMFLTPVIYPVAIIPKDVQWLVQLNPLTPLFEVFRYGLLGDGTFGVGQLLYSTLFALVLVVVSFMIFNKQGDKLIDVV
ncbi:ABC transporter permease [Cesiribacter andamanensis]|uniref:Transport permease protein n=1 Tax=Cesiribacter andamanensis AMV16 TaxID=1279009 RepID=M7N0M6_9BACT|nr:ABC transporter permease [Cesiribacter andamanensis]EMR00857.1 ABC-2 type transporter [Cesiribacter andamanensis AMV16]